MYLCDVLKREALDEPWGRHVVGCSLSCLARVVPAPAENSATTGASQGMVCSTANLQQSLPIMSQTILLRATNTVQLKLADFGQSSPRDTQPLTVIQSLG